MALDSQVQRQRHIRVQQQKPNTMHTPTVIIAGHDRTLVARARSELSRSGCRVSENVAGSFEDVRLIVRDWRDGRLIADPGVPVLTLDLAIIEGQELVDLVGRVLGIQQRDSFTGFLALLTIMQGKIPEA